MTIKKAYVELIDFLEANDKKKVSTILDELKEMCSAKIASSACIKDEDGKVLAVFCYYHKQWELISEVEFGKKASSASGLNTMCKVGTNKWTKQQRVAKQAKADLLSKVASGDILPEDITDMTIGIDSANSLIDPVDMPTGFASEADLKAFLAG